MGRKSASESAAATGPAPGPAGALDLAGLAAAVQRLVGTRPRLLVHAVVLVELRQARLARLAHVGRARVGVEEVRVDLERNEAERGERRGFDDRHVVKTEVNAWVATQVDATNLLAIMVEDFKVLIGSD